MRGGRFLSVNLNVSSLTFELDLFRGRSMTMIGKRLLHFFGLASLLTAVCMAAIGVPHLNREPSPEPPVDNVNGPEWTQFMRHYTEQQLDLPRDHLHPVYRHNLRYAQHYENHIRNRDTRYYLLVPEFEGSQGAIYITPWTWTRPEEVIPRQEVLVVNFWRESYNPIIHAGFRQGAVNDRGEWAWDYLNRIATITPDQIRERYGHVRF